MIRSNQINRNIVWFILTASVSLFLTICVMYPILQTGIEGVFYSIDPDIVYFSNALLYIKAGVVGYFDHPGTLAITTIAYSYIPIRLYTKLVLHQNFIEWAFYNFDYLIFYTRLFQSLLFFIGLTIFSWSVFVVSKSRLSQIISTLLIFGFTPIYFVVGSISAEPLTFFLTAVYMLLFANYHTFGKQWFLWGLFIVSGVLFSVRATTFFYIPLTFLVYCYTVKPKYLGLNSKDFYRHVVLIVIGFLIGVHPLKYQIVKMLSRLLFFAGSGQVHGGGSFFDIKNYITALTGFAYTDSLAAVLLFVVLLILIKNIRKGINLVDLVAATSVVGAFIFAKLPLSHYQLSNYVLLVFSAGYFSLKLNRFKKIFLLIIILLAVVPISNKYFFETKKSINYEVSLEGYIKENPAQKSTLWEWARSKDFAAIWVRDWGGGLFDKELSEVTKNFELSSDFTKIRTGASTYVNLSSFCWDTLYIQESSLERFINTNKHMQFTNNVVPGSEKIVSVKSKHCLK